MVNDSKIFLVTSLGGYPSSINQFEKAGDHLETPAFCAIDSIPGLISAQIFLMWADSKHHFIRRAIAFPLPCQTKFNLLYNFRD